MYIAASLENSTPCVLSELIWMTLFQRVSLITLLFIIAMGWGVTIVKQRDECVKIELVTYLWRSQQRNVLSYIFLLVWKKCFCPKFNLSNHWGNLFCKQLSCSKLHLVWTKLCGSPGISEFWNHWHLLNYWITYLYWSDQDWNKCQ